MPELQAMRAENVVKIKEILDWFMEDHERVRAIGRDPASAHSAEALVCFLISERYFEMDTERRTS